MRKILSLAIILAVQIHAQIQKADIDLGAIGSSDYSEATPGLAFSIRAVKWSHPNGNLLPNWSFENSQEFWSAGTSGDPRYRSTSAKSGYFVGRAVPGTTGAGLVSKVVALKNGQAYTLSISYASNMATFLKPIVTYYDMATYQTTPTVIGTDLGAAAYGATTGWSTNSWRLVPPPGRDCYASIALINGAGGVPAGLSLVFDDILLVEGGVTSAGLDRSQILTGVSVADPTGLALQAAFGSGADANYVASTVEYDNFWRKEKSYLPFQATATSTLSELTTPLASAKAAWTDAGNTPFSQVAYPSASAIGQMQSATSGDAWAPNAGHTSASGSVLVSTLGGIPTVAFESYVEAVADLTKPVEKPYVMKWSRDPDNNYAVSWSNVLGRVEKSAKLLDKLGKTTAPINPSLWKWVFTSYQYYDNGALKSVTVPPVSGSQVPPVVTSYDFQGRVIATSSPDEGLTRYWYDIAGRMRYRQRAVQMPNNQYTYFRYDDIGRLVSEGEATVPVMTQAIAEFAGSEKSYSANERKGWVYDNLEQNWATDLPNLTTVTQGLWANVVSVGRLVAKYHRNPQNTGTGLTAAQRLVVDFFRYDDLGRVSRTSKYMGAVTNLDDRLQEVSFVYDSAGRVNQQKVLVNMKTRSLPIQGQYDIWYGYNYDDKGRIKEINDAGLILASYTYDTWGRLADVNLGGGASNGTFSYNLHGQLTKLQAYGNGAQQYVQELGYESSAASTAAKQLQATLAPSNVPTPSFAGKITQNYEQYGVDQNVLNLTSSDKEIVKADNYFYDAAGRMTQVNGYTGVVAAAMDWYQDGEVKSATWRYQPNLSATYVYDDNDRISVANIGGTGTSAGYGYTSKTNLLDNVSGTFKVGSNRNASQSHNFTYDLNGQLLDDLSKRKTMTWDPEGLLSSATVTLTGSRTTTQIWPLYDADGLMVSNLTKATKLVLLFSGDLDVMGFAKVTRQTGAVHYVRMAGSTQKELRESWNWGTYSGATKIVNVQGQNSVIGRKIEGSYQYYLKNHQGSTTRVVDENGAAVSSYDYLAYGDMRTLRGQNPEVTEKYTGKGLDDVTGLYYFGARWYDAELGIWISPDPMGQYASPYGFSNSPLLGVDPNGLWHFGLGLVIGYTSHGGFSIGGGAAFDVGAVNADLSESYNTRNNSWTSEAGVGVCVGVCAGVDASYNTKSGTTLSENLGVGVGVGVKFSAGLDASQSWNASGDFMGGTFGVSAGVSGSYANARGGYELGYGSIQGRGLYASAGILAASASISENGGWDYGFSSRVASLDYTSGEGGGWKAGYIGKGLLTALRVEAAEESTMPVPERVANCSESTIYLCPNLGGDYPGPGPEGTGVYGISGNWDLGAYYHDYEYLVNDAAGPTSAFLDTKPGVMAADIRLAARAWGAFFGSNTNDGAPLRHQIRANLWSFGGATVFTAFAMNKFLGSNNPVKAQW